MPPSGKVHTPSSPGCRTQNPRTGTLQMVLQWKAWIFDRRHYTRLTSSKNLIPEIDGLRFIAIAAVFLCHLPTTLLKHREALDQGSHLETEVFRWMTFGGFGVQLFFMISGFIL